MEQETQINCNNFVRRETSSMASHSRQAVVGSNTRHYYIFFDQSISISPKQSQCGHSYDFTYIWLNDRPAGLVMYYVHIYWGRNLRRAAAYILYFIQRINTTKTLVATLHARLPLLARSNLMIQHYRRRAT